MKEEQLFKKFLIEEIEALQLELNEGNIDVHKFYEEIISLKEYIKNNPQ